MSFIAGEDPVGVTLSCGTMAVVTTAHCATKGHVLAGCVCVRMAGAKETRLVYLPWLCSHLQWGAWTVKRFKGCTSLFLATEFIALASWLSVTCCPHHHLFSKPNPTLP